MFDLNEYDYKLPPEAIAQFPALKRDHSRLLVVDRQNKKLLDRRFYDLPRLLRQNDLIVANNTRVVPARLLGKKETGGQVELLILGRETMGDDHGSSYVCLFKSSKGPRKGNLISFSNGVVGRIEEIMDNGRVRILFFGDLSIDSLMEKTGQIPLPPYINRQKDDDYSRYDNERYQTIFSTQRGAVAAPTAGLHFTQSLISKLAEAGVDIAFITLHVGYGTFQPVRTQDIRKHRLGEEVYRVEKQTIEKIKTAKKNGGRIIAVGTTVVRTLETAVNNDGSMRTGWGKTDLLITPGFSFKTVDALITNFHLPKSSLLFLVSAFAGLDLIKNAYKWAMEKDYRFYSYGDAMFVC